jgi:hypothetical protein
MRTFNLHKQKTIMQTKAHIGMIVAVYGVKCRIFRIHPLGTIDVEEINGPRAWRLSGLPLQ